MLTYFVKKKINNTSVSTFNHAILKFRICIILVPVLDNIYVLDLDLECTVSP